MSQVESSPRAWARLRWLGLMGLLSVVALSLVPGTASAAKAKGKTLNVMSRNLYLGADLSPALNATGLDAAVNAGGQIVNQVHATKFPSVRAAQLAAEIQKRKPDIVGIQEGAWWRTGPPPSNLGEAVTRLNNPTASTTDPLGGDFLTDLLNALNSGGGKKGKKGSASASKKGGTVRYRLAVVKTEFDAELPVNNGSGGFAAATKDERLTMRDAILVRQGGGIKVSNPTSGTFNTLLQVKVAGVVPLNVTRGWAAVDVKAHGRKFHVVDTHLEAFDSNANNTGNDGKTYPKGGVRQAQAQQLVGAGGPANVAKTILIGDLNSDFPVHGDQVFPGDALAYQAVLAGGFQERSPAIPPFGCCLDDPFIANPSTAGITHRVDHIMSNTNKVRFKKGGLTTTYSNGLWSSDHFGLFSSLLIK